MHVEALCTKPIKQLYFAYLVPTLIAMASNTLYCLVDVYFISKGAGSTGLAALNIVMPVFSIYSAIGLTMGVGGATVMAIAEGNKNTFLRNQAFTLSIIVMVVVGGAIALFGNLFLDQFAYMLGSSKELLIHVKEYLGPINLVAFAFVLMSASSILIRADHKPKLAMNALLVGNLSNIVFDYIFVIVLNMGLFGAGIATAIAPFLTILVIAINFMLKKNTVQFIKDFYDTSLLKRMLSNGLGSGIMELSSGIIILVFNFVILKFADDLFLAAFAIVTNIAYVCRGLINGFAQAAQPIISVNKGARQYTRVKSALRISIISSVVFSFVLFLIFLLVPSFVASFFTNGDIALLEKASQGIRFYFTSIMFTATITMIMYYFQAMEHGHMATLLAVCKGFVFVILGLWILISLLGIDGIWFSITFAEGLALVIACIFLKKVGEQYGQSDKS